MPYYQVIITKHSITKYLIEAPSAWEVNRRAWNGGIDEDSELVLKYMGDEIDDVAVMDETGMEMIDIPLENEDEDEEEKDERDTAGTDQEE